MQRISVVPIEIKIRRRYFPDGILILDVAPQRLFHGRRSRTGRLKRVSLRGANAPRGRKTSRWHHPSVQNSRYIVGGERYPRPIRRLSGDPLRFRHLSRGSRKGDKRQVATPRHVALWRGFSMIQSAADPRARSSMRKGSRASVCRATWTRRPMNGWG